MHRIAWLIGALIVSGCSAYDLTDPYKRPGTCDPTGAQRREPARHGRQSA